MNASDIVTSTVVTVSPDTSITTLARLLLDNKISAAPVVDEAGHVVGIVSEGDLLGRPSARSRRVGGSACSTNRPSVWRSWRRLGI
jgi:CBS domain-containing protein